MTTESKLRRSDRTGLWMLLAVVVITAAVFFWTSSRYHEGGSASLETHIDARGHLHVLGITLGETNLKQAEIILQSKSDVALYIYPQEHPKAGLKLEAFFPAIADHTKVILLLDLTQAQLKGLESRATIPHQYQNRVARMNLAPDDIINMRHATISELTLIPNLILTAENLKNRFGKPDHIRHLDSERDQYDFNAIGLQATLSKESPPTLHFTNPAARK
ncbi:hypothetical protein [Mariprofundus ferrooxydans]|uniref:hypothetical protein n=1 Tax=Mariprofundus ferrooxydans TaxID=314344 RepID=UPI00143143DB|nr:hypothetical protein [Mariprofundus ferrooxydans]